MSDPYRILPGHTPAEIEIVRASLEAHGLLPGNIIIDTEERVIDGHLLRDLCLEVGIEWLAGAVMQAGLTEHEKLALAITRNLARRATAPTQAQRRHYAEILLLSRPEASERSIAVVVGVSQSTIHNMKQQLIITNQLVPSLRTVGLDGKTRLVSSDKRRASMQIKNAAEAHRIGPVAAELHAMGPDLLPSGVIRRPGKLPALLRRERALARVAAAGPQVLPPSIAIHCCDFRDLPVEPESVDLVCTDVYWANGYEGDWADLAECASRWLKRNGLFCTFIGQQHMFKCAYQLDKHLHNQHLFLYTFSGGYRTTHSSVIEGFRPILVFSRKDHRVHNFLSVKDTIVLESPSEKEYHDYQQPLEVVRELVRRLVPLDGRPMLVCDPQVGSGTTAVACAQLGLPCIAGDIDPKAVASAHYRVAHEAAS